jgi:hypothetical protein
MALKCLYIAVDKEIAEDVNYRVKNYVSALLERDALLGVEIRSYLGMLEKAQSALKKIREHACEAGLDPETETYLLSVIRDGLSAP